MKAYAGFLARDVENIIGIKRTRLQQWLERGFITPSVQVAEGSGTRNVYNEIDLYNIALFKKISESGFQRKLVADFIGIGVMPSKISDKELSSIKFMIFFRKEDKIDGAAVTYTPDDPVVLDLYRLVKQLKMERFDDMYLVNFAKIKREVDAKIDRYFADY